MLNLLHQNPVGLADIREAVPSITLAEQKALQIALAFYNAILDEAQREAVESDADLIKADDVEAAALAMINLKIEKPRDAQRLQPIIDLIRPE